MDIRLFFGLRCSDEIQKSIDDSFRNMICTFTPEMVAEHTRAVIEYRIKKCGDWHLIIANKTCELKQGRATMPDLCLITDHKTWLAISEGLETGEEMYMKRKLRVKGDQNLLMQLPQLFTIENYKPNLLKDQFS